MHGRVRPHTFLGKDPRVVDMSLCIHCCYSWPWEDRYGALGTAKRIKNKRGLGRRTIRRAGGEKLIVNRNKLLSPVRPDAQQTNTKTEGSHSRHNPTDRRGSTASGMDCRSEKRGRQQSKRDQLQGKIRKEGKARCQVQGKSRKEGKARCQMQGRAEKGQVQEAGEFFFTTCPKHAKRNI